MLHRLKIACTILLLAIALFDIVISFGVAHGHGIAYTTKIGTCFGFTLFEGEYRLFYATRREAGVTGFESITYPWRSRIFNPFPTSSEFLGFESEDLTLDWSEYGHLFPPPGAPAVRIQALSIPHWPILYPSLGIPILIWFIAYRRRRHRRLNPTLCPACNYDLRAHAPNAICPECGTPIRAAPSTKP